LGTGTSTGTGSDAYSPTQQTLDGDLITCEWFTLKSKIQNFQLLTAPGKVASKTSEIPRVLINWLFHPTTSLPPSVVAAGKSREKQGSICTQSGQTQTIQD